MRDLVRSGVGQHLGERDHTRLANVRWIAAIEIALDLVEGIRREQLNEVRRDVAQERLPGPEPGRRTLMATLTLLLGGPGRQRAA